MTGQDNPAKPNPFAAREPSIRAPIASTPDRASYPIYEMDADSCRLLDEICLTEYGISGIALMENAGAGLCKHAIEMLGGIANPRVEIYCGPGNNAGDGLVLARRLANYRINPKIHLLIDPNSYTGDAATNMRIVTRLGLDAEVFGPVTTDKASDLEPIAADTLVVDAIFGTGLKRAPEGISKLMIEAINAKRKLGAQVLAVDVPSGFDAQRGQPSTPCVQADRTVSLAALKSGFTALHAQGLLGHVVVEDIGIPIQAMSRLGNLVQSPSAGIADQSGNL